MNLHSIAPAQTRFVTTIVIRHALTEPDPCEWKYLGIDDIQCANDLTWAVVDTSIYEQGFHGIDGFCMGHYCDDHIELAFANAIASV